MMAFIKRCRLNPLLTLVVALLLSLSASLLDFQSVSAAPPANDSFANAVVISTLPYFATQSTVEASEDGGDPFAECAPGLGGSGRAKSVWYRYTASGTGLVTLKTTGSSYDTVISVWTGGEGTFTAVPNACNNDLNSRQSTLQVNMISGTTYHIMIGEFGNEGVATGGTLNLFVRSGPITGALEWMGPSSMITNAGGDPIYAWSNVGAVSYALYVANATTPQTPAYFGWGLSAQCAGAACTFNPVSASSEVGRLMSGTYLAWVRGSGNWVGPYTFALNANRPFMPDFEQIIDVNTLTPRIDFDITADVRYVQVVVWPAATFPNNPVFAQWFYRGSLCDLSDVCSYRLTTPLPDNTTYILGLQGYGSGGVSEGGQYNGWDGTTFTIDTIPNPPIPTNLAATTGNGTPQLSWTTSAAATRHYVSVFSHTTNTWIYGQYHEKIGDPALTCSAATCVLVTDALLVPNGSYSFYVNAEGPGGASTGGTFNNGFAGPDDPANASEAGDFNFSLPAPSVANLANLAATTFSSTVSFSFTGDLKSSSYNIWVGTAGGAQVFGFQNISAYDLTCHADTSCVGMISITAPIPSGTQFYLAVQAIGPGGSSTGGPVSNGYQVSTAFTAP
ncbi:MAG: hypothetical protein SF029_11655 [bacterium]|nr:hypothetical protein [bacterium]